MIFGQHFNTETLLKGILRMEKLQNPLDLWKKFPDSSTPLEFQKNFTNPTEDELRRIIKAYFNKSAYRGLCLWANLGQYTNFHGGSHGPTIIDGYYWFIGTDRAKEKDRVGLLLQSLRVGGQFYEDIPHVC